MRGRFAWTLGVSLALGIPAFAVEPGDVSQMQAVVGRQIEALRVDDAEAAYSLASPAIRLMFGSADGFMAMVEQGYRPVYRPRRYEFGESRDAQAGPEMAVRLDDAEGVAWTAIYSFERLPDGAWAISGCRLLKSPDQSV